jgi:hypothetical protein
MYTAAKAMVMRYATAKGNDDEAPNIGGMKSLGPEHCVLTTDQTGGERR